jgi:hypothetical protein
MKDRKTLGEKVLNTRYRTELHVFLTRTHISQQWISSYSPPNLTKLRHKGHLNKRNIILNEVSRKFKDFLFDFG